MTGPSRSIILSESNHIEARAQRLAEVRKVFDAAEDVTELCGVDASQTECRASGAAPDADMPSDPGQMKSSEEPAEVPPVRPLGHNAGTYYFVAPSRELRHMKAEALEGGRGVKALFSGFGDDVERWCRGKFPSRDGDWSSREAGNWIIAECNSKGIFDPGSADIRSVGVWRLEDDTAVAHCGDKLVDASGRFMGVHGGSGTSVMIAGPSMPPPEVPEMSHGFAALVESFEAQFAWQRKEDPTIYLGWVAAAALGGYPHWRAHLYVTGGRGSGKSTLIELTDTLLGKLSGGVVNDATEAGLRQSRNNQARPLLIDEFEPDDNLRNASRQDSMLALFRRMSGGKGGRTARGGADHNAVSFRTLGPAYVTSINHIHLEPQDRSRFVMLELGSNGQSLEPAATAVGLEKLRATCRASSPSFRGKMLKQSEHWDMTVTRISARARELGADNRQADTAATVLAGFDLLVNDGPIDDRRLDLIVPQLKLLIEDAGESEEASEGRDALDHILSAQVSLDHGIKRSVSELVAAVRDNTPCSGVEDPERALGRYGIYLTPDRMQVAFRTGRTTPTASIFSETKWRNGAHVSALLKLNGASRPKFAMRPWSNLQVRVLLVPLSCLDPETAG